jgi:hypothetical protein
MWISSGVVPCIIYFGTRWNWVVSFMLQLLYPEERTPHYTLSWSGCFWEIRCLCFCQESNPDFRFFPAWNLVVNGKTSLIPKPCIMLHNTKFYWKKKVHVLVYRLMASKLSCVEILGILIFNYWIQRVSHLPFCHSAVTVIILH